MLSPTQCTELQRGIYRCLNVLAGALLLLALPAATLAADTWQAYTYLRSPTVAATKGFKKLVEEIEKAAGPELRINFNLGGTLTINATRINTAVSEDLIQIADDGFYHDVVPLAAIATLPLLVRGLDDMNKVMAIVRPLAERDYARKGVTVLGYYVNPAPVFWFSDKVNSPAEIKGRNIRVISLEQADIIKAFGGIPVQLGAAEIPAALRGRRIDGILSTSAGGVAAWKELLKSSYGLGVNYSISYIIANSGRLKKLSPSLQNKIRDIASRSLPEQTAELQREEVELRKKLAADGITMVPAKAEDLARAERASGVIWDDWAKAQGREGLRTLDEVRKVLRR